MSVICSEYGTAACDALLGLDDARCRDEFHGARDLLRGLNGSDPPRRMRSWPPAIRSLSRQGLVGGGASTSLGIDRAGIDRVAATSAALLTLELAALKAVDRLAPRLSGTPAL